MKISAMNTKRKLKQYHTCVDPALNIIEQLNKQLTEHDESQLRRSIRVMDVELRLIKMFFWGLSFNEELIEADLMLRVTLLAEKFRRTALAFEAQFIAAAQEQTIIDLEQMSLSLRAAIEELASHIRELCIVLLDGAFKCEYSFQFEQASYEYGNETARFVQLIFWNLRFVASNIHVIATIRQDQIPFIRRKLFFLHKFLFALSLYYRRPIRTDRLIYHMQTWATHVSCLTCLYWIDGWDLTRTSTMEQWFSDLMLKSTPGPIPLFLDVFKAAKYHKLRGDWCPDLLVHYVDFLLQQYVKDDIEYVREGLTFLLSFVMDSPNEDSRETELLVAEIYAIMSEEEFLGCISKIDISSDFLHKIDEVKKKVSDLYTATTVSSLFRSAKTDASVFLDSLLETLHNMVNGEVDFIPSVKNGVIAVQEGLESLRPFLLYDLELLNDDNKLKDLHSQIFTVIHYASYVTMLCPITSFSVWYGILFLPNVMQHINLVKDAVKEIGDELDKCSSRKLIDGTETIVASLPQATPSINEGVFIGFSEEAGSISDNLLWGHNVLTIVSISGMPGQGKTTLARRIFNDPSIQNHFARTAWCHVSRKCNISRLLANILQQVDKGKDCDKLDINSLAGDLRKCLKQKRYFIVLDDIWDVNVWLQLKDSFPDDENGSRILCTTRNHDLAIQCKPNSISRRLRFFSDEESLELMKDKLSSKDYFPQELEEIGRRIAILCKGLPLAVVVIAALLKRIGPALDSWIEVAENLKSHLATEGCFNIIEQSYKHLPHPLQLCFLSFGSLPRIGYIIKGKLLIRQWIAQGFVKENELRCSEELAREYLNYLVSQNLVTVDVRGSTGNIKWCHVHDLIYDFCFQKAKEDNLLQLADYRTLIDQSFQPSPKKYNFHHHWLCVHDHDPTPTKLTCDSTRIELPTSQVTSLIWRLHSIVPIKYNVLSTFLHSFGVLTMLDMMYVDLRGSMFPEAILYNVYLRYLGLRGSFSHIPSAISNLWNLKTLVLSNRKNTLLLPDSLWRIKGLRHIDVRLFHGVWDFGEMSSMAAANNITSISEIILSSEVKMWEFLKSLSNLRKLGCAFHKNIHPEWLSMLGELGKLESLSISLSYESVPLSHRWRNPILNFPDTLKKLSLWRLELPLGVMSMIGRLPNLESLKLWFNAVKGITWDLGDGEFSKLKFLKLYRINVKQIKDSDCDDPFPRLEKLLVYHCKRLDEIPLNFGYIYPLNTIRIIASPKALNSVNTIVEVQREYLQNQDLQLVVLDHDPMDYYYVKGDDDFYGDDNNDEEERS